MSEILSVNVALKSEYFIPTYQRGYRWGDKQVNDLVEDLVDYFDTHYKKNEDGTIESLSATNKDFYCLQTLIIKENGGEKYSVVDGQQRLTTMYILSSYLNKEKGSNIQLGKITYQFSRDNDTAGYLAKLQELGVNDSIEKEKRDIYFISNAYKVLSKVPSDKIDKIKYLVDKECIKFIKQCYKADLKADERELFESINTGKIPLKDSELIRAKLLLNSLDDERNVRARRWDEIENKLQMDSFWYFIYTKRDKKNTEALNKSEAKIDYLFEILANNLVWLEQNDKKRSDMLSEINDVNGSSEHRIFAFFKNHRFDLNGENVEDGDTFENYYTTERFWKKAVELYSILLSWYNNIELYNYMGCVLYMYSEEKNIVNLLINKYLKIEYDEFIELLKMLILRSFGDVQGKCDKDKNDPCKLKMTWDVSGIWPTYQIPKYKIQVQNKRDIYKYVLPSNNSQNPKKVQNEMTLDYYDYDGLFDTSSTNEKLSPDDLVEKPKAKVFKSIWYSGRDKSSSEWSENRKRCDYFLLWSNCELLNKQYRSTIERNKVASSFEMYKFPFDVYKTRGVDIEHVASYKEIEGADEFWLATDDAKKNRKEWFDIAVGLMTDEQRVEYDTKADVIENNTSLSQVDQDKEKMGIIWNVFGDDKDGLELVDPSEKNFDDIFLAIQKVGNLTLLDPNINRGYQNAPFRMKRRDIIMKSLDGIYVYPCTKLVFLKEFDEKANDLFRWSKVDSLLYRDFVARLFLECFCLKKTENGEKYDNSMILKCVEAGIL